MYGTPPGSDPALPVYGSRKSVTSAEPTRHDFDPRAEEKAVVAAAAAAAREAKAAEAARAAKASSQKRAAEKAAKRAAARAAYAEKKERTTRIAEATRRAREERSRARGNRNYDRVLRRRAAAAAPEPDELVRPKAPARRIGIVPKMLLAALVIAGAIFVPIIVTNNSSSSPTFSDGVDWTEYPGKYAGDELKTLGGPRKEDVVADDTALLEELRVAVQKEVAVSWIEHGTGTEVPLENAWGGPSMLVDWQSPRWYTTEEIPDVELKKRLVASVSEVLADHGFDAVRLRNDPAGPFASDDLLKQSYGAVNPEEQVVWQLYASRFGNSFTGFTFTITDFSKDTTGEFAEDAAIDAEFHDRPVSSLAMTLTSSSLLSTLDEPEFRERAAPFEDKDPPRYP